MTAIECTAANTVSTLFTEEEKDYDSLLQAIGSSTTKEAFDQLAANVRDFDPKKGGSFGITVLAKCALTGNAALAAHLISKYGNGILKQGDMFGMLPLSYAAHCMVVERGLEVAKVLVMNGADINAEVERGFFLPELMPVPSNTNRNK